MTDMFTNARDKRAQMDEALLAGRGFNYYQALGVDARASSREIREAYRNTVRLTSPAKLDQSTSAYYRYLGEALDVLTNKATREAYDESLGDISSYVSRRFSPASVTFPLLENMDSLLGAGELKVVPGCVGKIQGIFWGLVSSVGLGFSAWILPSSDGWLLAGWIALIVVATLFLCVHPNLKSPVPARAILGYALGFYFFCGFGMSNLGGEVTWWGMMLAGLLSAVGIGGVGEWWRSSNIYNGDLKGFRLSKDFIVKHKEFGAAGESWRWMSRKGNVSSANLTKETFTQQMTADILMRLSSAPGVRIIHGIDVGVFMPHVVVAGNKIAVVEGMIVDDGNQTITKRGIVEPVEGSPEDESVLSCVPSGVSHLESLCKGAEVRGWVLLIPKDGSVVKAVRKGDGGRVSIGDANQVLKELAEFFSQGNNKDVIDLRLVNTLWSRKMSE